MSTHDTYYVPAQSKWPIIATFGLLITVYDTPIDESAAPFEHTLPSASVPPASC